MKNYRSSGDKITVTAVAATTAGYPYVSQNIRGIAESTQSIGSDVVICLQGIYEDIPKKAPETWLIHDRLYWDTANNHLTNTNGALTFWFVGYAADAADSSATIGNLILAQPSVHGGNAIADLTTTTVADATGNSLGDLNGVILDINGRFDEVDAKINAILDVL